MLEVGFDRARCMFQPSCRCVSTVLEHARSTLPSCSRYVSIVLDRSPGLFRFIIPCSIYNSILLQVCFDRARCIFWPDPRYILTVLEVCFGPARVLFQSCTRYVLNVLNRARGIFCTFSIYILTQHEVCSWSSSYVSTVLEVYFDRARDMFWPCSSCFSIVLEVRFDHGQGMFRLYTIHMFTKIY